MEIVCEDSSSVSLVTWLIDRHYDTWPPLNAVMSIVRRKETIGEGYFTDSYDSEELLGTDIYYQDEDKYHNWILQKVDEAKDRWCDEDYVEYLNECDRYKVPYMKKRSLDEEEVVQQHNKRFKTYNSNTNTK